MPAQSDSPRPPQSVLLRNRAVARLRAAMNYWLSTTRPDGRPHAAPVWGVWLDDALWFGTTGQKAKNLEALPYAVVHLESGDDVAIVEGPVDRVSDPAALGRVADAYRAKYVDGESGKPFELLAAMSATGSMYRLTPERGWAWLEGAFASANTRWTSEE